MSIFENDAKRSTTTSTFGVSKRESHNSDPFYKRFPPLQQDKKTEPSTPVTVDQLYVGDSSNMGEINANSTALVVTSPPYFVGKEYEVDIEKEGIPASYIEYLQMLRSVFTECWRILEPGGRIAINIANLGRKPYRSLSADITRILQEDIGFLLRGEIIWIKAEGASGSCAWGSFQSASNPVLRDVTERVIVASKLRFDRSLTKKQRAARGLPHIDSIKKDDFLSWTIDTWRFRPESAKKIGHPAPFPLELPKRLIELYSYEDDLIVDPFCGSGTTAVAAKSANRHYVGYDLDPEYISLAKKRLEDT